jgi:4-hydroxybutyryl-CoA dehydratase/vinylacetyl-CoA-Delta-isomerase
MVPDDLYTNAAKYYAAAEFNLMSRHLIDIAGGSVVTAPSVADLESPDIGPQVERYMTGDPTVSGEQRLKIMHAIRDVVADAYGGWRSVTAIHGGGGLYAQRLVTRSFYPMAGAVEIARTAAGLDSPPTGEPLVGTSAIAQSELV